MEVSQDQLIGIALNALGYLAAGALWMVIYSFFKDRKKAGVKTSRSASDLVKTKAPVTTAVPAGEKTPVEFINLSRSDKPAAKTTALSPESGTVERSRRNRAEVIKMAQEMLKANATSEKIKNTLPITEGELAMIRNK